MERHRGPCGRAVTLHVGGSSCEQAVCGERRNNTMEVTKSRLSGPAHPQAVCTGMTMYSSTDNIHSKNYSVLDPKDNPNAKRFAVCDPASQAASYVRYPHSVYLPQRN
jgi:hypothetical protein